MPDDKTNRGPADGARVNIHEPYEVAYWTKKFGCTADQLKACVTKSGVMAAAVEKCVKGK